MDNTLYFEKLVTKTTDKKSGIAYDYGTINIRSKQLRAFIGKHSVIHIYDGAVTPFSNGAKIGAKKIWLDHKVVVLIMKEKVK